MRVWTGNFISEQQSFFRVHDIRYEYSDAQAPRLLDSRLSFPRLAIVPLYDNNN